MSRNKFRQKARNQKKKQERKERGGPFKTKFLGVKKQNFLVMKTANIQISLKEACQIKR